MKTKIFIVIVINILVFIALLIWWQKGTFITTNTSPSSSSPSSTSSPPSPSSPSAPAPPVTTLKESSYPKKPTVVYRPEFEYLSATYGPLSEEGKIGTGFKGQDITGKLKFDKNGNVLNPFMCCSETLGDPAQGVPKVLTIFYKRNGRRYKAILQEKTPIEGRLPP